MKVKYLCLIVTFSICLCSGLKPAFAQEATLDTLKISPTETAGDTVAYDLIIFDPGFNSWFNRVKRPESYYSESYLESWNTKLVMQCNALLHQSGRSACMPSTYLDYDWRTSYGLTLNYRLYYYFRYMQVRCQVFYDHPVNW
jgi:hypothetical protein